MPTAFAYRRALRRFATCIVFTILNLVVCALMIHWVAGQKVSPVLLLLIVPLALTLGNMWRCTVGDLLYIDRAISSASAGAALQATTEV
jgi:hypothetical protein